MFNEKVEMYVGINHSKQVMCVKLQEKQLACHRRLDKLRTAVRELTEQCAKKMCKQRDVVVQMWESPPPTH